MDSEIKDKIIVADDHWVTRTGVAGLCNTLFPDYKVLQAADLQELIHLIESVQGVDMLVLDNFLGDAMSITLLTKLRLEYGIHKIMILSQGPEKAYGLRALKAGAISYICKTSPEEKLVEALRKTMKGEYYLSEEILQQFLIGTISFTKHQKNPFDDLSEREMEVVLLILRGYDLAEISRVMQIARTSVSTYKSRIYSKLLVTKITELKNLAKLYGIYLPPYHIEAYKSID